MQRKRIHFYIIVLTAVGLTACKIGKNYQRPDTKLPEQFSNPASSDTGSIADIEWKKFFTDTTLQALLENGINYNNDLLVAKTGSVLHRNN